MVLACLGCWISVGKCGIDPAFGRLRHTGACNCPFMGLGSLGILDGARQTVMNTLESSSDEEKGDYGMIKEKIRQDLKRFIVKNTSRRPLIMPVILEV